MVELLLAKEMTGVRFPLAAPDEMSSLRYKDIFINLTELSWFINITPKISSTFISKDGD